MQEIFSSEFRKLYKSSQPSQGNCKATGPRVHINSKSATVPIDSSHNGTNLETLFCFCIVEKEEKQNRQNSEDLRPSPSLRTKFSILNVPRSFGSSFGQEFDRI